GTRNLLEPDHYRWSIPSLALIQPKRIASKPMMLHTAAALFSDIRPCVVFGQKKCNGLIQHTSNVPLCAV
ncbi:MAG TPA: hypothetical protein VG759_06455, partial [Candidatus Angelobacter sp.]|nr:hypothetical protein [Candidatus Angelobacter sp.]